MDRKMTPLLWSTISLLPVISHFPSRISWINPPYVYARQGFLEITSQLTRLLTIPLSCKIFTPIWKVPPSTDSAFVPLHQYLSTSSIFFKLTYVKLVNFRRVKGPSISYLRFRGRLLKGQDLLSVTKLFVK